MGDPGTDCPSGKHRHVTKKKAQAHKRRMKDLVDSGGLNVYKCPSCGFWHIGHKPGTRKGARLGRNRRPGNVVLGELDEDEEE